MLLSLIFLLLPIELEGWETFAKVRFEIQYIEELGFEAEMPVFDPGIREKAGKEITLVGYHLPLKYDRKTIVLSKQPFASCFFCGGGVGQETIAEIHFVKKQRLFKPDEILEIRGKLRLNDSDFDHFVFILEEAVLVE